MTDTFDIDSGDCRAIKAAQRSYDNIDRREKKAEQREKNADQLYSGIKSYKKKIKNRLKKEIANQVMLAESQANG